MEMEKEYYLKAGELTGHCQLARFHKVVADAEELIAIKKAIGSGVHKAYGLTAKEYCPEKCGIPYSTYHMYETEMGRIGKDLYILKGIVDLSPGDIQALAALPEDSKVKVNEKKNIIEVEGRQIPVENSQALIETINAILKRAELADGEKQLAQKETKHAQKSLEGIGKEYKKEIKAYEDKVRDLEAKVVDPTLPEGFEMVMKSIERKFDEIHTAITKLRYDDVYGDDPEEGHKRALYIARVNVLDNQYHGAIKRMGDVFGVDTDF